MNVFEEVKNRVSLYDAVAFYSATTVKGGKILCPFHREKTPSCSISKDGMVYHCFGCGEGGDVITYVEKLLGLSPLQAAMQIGQDFHLSLQGQEKRAAPAREISPYLARQKEKQELDRLFQRAVEKYRRCRALLARSEPFSDRYVRLNRILERQLFYLDMIQYGHVEEVKKWVEKGGQMWKR